MRGHVGSGYTRLVLRQQLLRVCTKGVFALSNTTDLGPSPVSQRGAVREHFMGKTKPRLLGLAYQLPGCPHAAPWALSGGRRQHLPLACALSARRLARDLSRFSCFFVFGSPSFSVATAASVRTGSDVAAAASVGAGTHALLSTCCVAATGGSHGRDCGGYALFLPFFLVLFFFLPWPAVASPPNMASSSASAC